MRDLKSNVDVVQSLAPAARSANTAVNGSSANLQGYRGAVAVVSCGTLTDGTHTPSLQESSDNASFSNVAAADMTGSFAALTANSSQRVGYVGNLQYIRVVLTTAGATTGALSSAEIVRGFPQNAPLP